MSKERDLLINISTVSQDETLLEERRKLLEGGDFNWNYLLAEADYHRLVSLLYYNLQKSKLYGLLPDGVKSKLEKKHYAVAFSNQKISQELKRLLAVFDAKGVGVIILKGPVLDEVIYPEKGLRPFGDLDILIRPEDLTRVENILYREGYTLPVGILPKRFYRQFHFELPFVNKEKGGTYLEIHWDLLPRWRLHSKDVIEVWKRREILEKDKSLYSLSGEDMIIYLCGHLDLHAYMNRYHYSSAKIKDYIFKRSSGNRLIWFSDLLETIRFLKNMINWEEIIERAKRWGLNSAVYANLSIMERLFPSVEGKKRIERFSTLRQDGIKKRFLLLTEKVYPPAKERSLLENKLGFRRPLSLADLIEYVFPDRNALEARYGYRPAVSPSFFLLGYRLRCLFEGLKAIFIIILK